MIIGGVWQSENILFIILSQNILSAWDEKIILYGCIYFQYKMFYPEWCDDDDGNDEHDSGEDEGCGEETGHDSQSVHLSLQ